MPRNRMFDNPKNVSFLIEARKHRRLGEKVENSEEYASVSDLLRHIIDEYLKGEGSASE